MKSFKRETTMKDALHNLAPRSGASLDYCTGLVVGVVSCMMADEVSFADAIDAVARLMPHGEGTRLAVPDCWMQDLKGALLACREVYIREIHE